MIQLFIKVDNKILIFIEDNVINIDMKLLSDKVQSTFISALVKFDIGNKNYFCI
jgi:hypothetical protein